MDNLLDAAVKAARAAGAIIRAGLGQAHTVDLKGVINPVTEVDRAAEAAILQILRAAAPMYSILSEESGLSEGAGEARWVVDPLDGTVNYVHHVPYVGVSIGLERAGQVELGVVYNPVLDELFTAERGRGARLNGQPIQVSAVSDLGQSIIASGFPYDVWETGGTLEEFARVTRRAQTVRVFGAAVLDMAHVACGRLEAYWDSGLSPWDVAAGGLLVREAGGIVTFHGGDPARLESQTMIAANSLVYRELAGLVQPR